MLGPVLVMAIAMTVFHLVNRAPLPAGFVGEASSFDNALRAGEWRARFLWEATLILLAVSALATIFLAGWVFRHLLDETRRRPVLLWVLAFSVVGLLSALRSDVSFRFTEAGLLRPTLGAFADATGAIFSLAAFERARMASNGLVTVATVFLAFAVMACSTLSPLAEDETAPGETQVRRLGARLRALSALLYAGTLVLVFLVLSMVAWLHWPAALLADPAAQDRVREVALGLSLFWGTAFTLVLAAVYLPAAWYLRAETYLLAERATGGGTPAQQEAWIGERGLGLSLAGQFSRLTALAGPLIAGALPSLQNLLA